MVEEIFNELLRILNLYPLVKKENLLNINVAYKLKVEYWLANDCLQDYKIYVITIYMFNLKFLKI
jgi:hypothetical protein